MTAQNQRLSMSYADLDGTMPMALVVDNDARILWCGRTLKKIFRHDAAGEELASLIEIRHRSQCIDPGGLRQLENQQITAHLRDDPTMSFKGGVICLARPRRVLITLSPGVAFAEIVARYDLNIADFAPTDQIVEMLFQMETNAGIRALSRDLLDRLQDARIAAEEQSYTDMLTGLRNRRALDHVLGRLTGPARDEPFGLMQIDLDYFKSVNDTLGHGAGDAVLRRVAEVLNTETRKHDLVTRVGGDEFVILFRDCNDLKLLDRIARRIIDGLEVPVIYEGQACRISASIGTTISGYYKPPEADVMMQDADTALYRSKNRGRARHTIFEPHETCRAGD